MSNNFNIIEYMAARRKAMVKWDDANVCEAHDGECEICPRKGKCRFRGKY